MDICLIYRRVLLDISCFMLIRKSSVFLYLTYLISITVLITFVFLLSQNASPPNQQLGRNMWATAGVAVAVFLAVTGYSC